MQCRIFAVVTNYNNASETPHSSPHKPQNEKFPENAAWRGGRKDFSLSTPSLLALFAEPLAVGEEPLHPNDGLRYLNRLGRRFWQGWRFVRLAGSPIWAGTTGKCYRGCATKLKLTTITTNENRLTMKIELNLLNPDKLGQIKGGYSCNKTGDTIACALIGKVVVCITGEASCGANFSSSCNKEGISINCDEGFTIIPKQG